MTTIDVTKHGVANNGTPVSEAITSLIASSPDNTEIFFPAGQYFLDSAVEVHGKNNLTIRGDGAVLITHFTPWNDPSENNNGFNFRECSNIEVRNFTCTTDNPTSCAGRVIAKDESASTYDVKIDEQFPITGWEHFWGTDTCDEEGTPDYVIETYDHIIHETVKDENGNDREKITGTKYTYLGNNVIRVHMPNGFDLSRLTVGHRVLYRYAIYSSTVFTFADCHTVALRHIEIERCTSMGAVISPRCSDFTFEDFNIRSPKESHALYAANADGIHILGLSGYLHMKDCSFEGLGDDALNIHSQAGEISAYNEAEGTVSCIYRNRDMSEGSLGTKWAKSGDVINVYDRETFLQKGTITLSDYKNGTAFIKSYTGAFAPGDILANDSFFASVHLENCEVRHTRARGFLFQSRNMLIENCRIYGMSLPGIIISPDIRVWYEVGPSRNVEIRNCTFEKCGINGSSANLGAIVVKAAHDRGGDSYPAGVHQDIRIHDNLFKNCGNSGIFVSASEKIQIYGNKFENCGMLRFDEKVESTAYDIALRNCRDVKIGENQTDKASDHLLYEDNCD